MKTRKSTFNYIFSAITIIGFSTIVGMEKFPIINITNNEKEKNIFRELPTDIQRTILMYSLADFFITPKTFVGHSQRVDPAAICNNTLITGSGDHTVKIWNMDTNVCERTLHYPGYLRTIAVNIIHKTIIMTSYHSTEIWDLDKTVCLKKLNHRSSLVGAMAVSCDGTKIVCGLWNNNAAIFDQQGNLIAKCEDHELIDGKSSSVSAIAISPDNTYIVKGSGWGIVTLWNMKGKRLYRFGDKSNNHKGGLIKIAISSDSQKIVTGDTKGIVKVWNNEGQLLYNLVGHNQQIRSIDITSDDKYMITCAFDGKIKIWDMNTGTLKHTLKHESVGVAGTISSNDKFIATGHCDGILQLWDLESGTLLYTFGIFDRHTAQINTVLIDADDTRVVTTSCDGTAKIWPLHLDVHTTEFTNPEHPLFWIKHNIIHPQADLIKRACAKTQEKRRFIINFLSADAKVFLSLPAHVRTYLLECLNIYLSVEKI